MIAKASAISHGGAGIDYALKEEKKAEVIDKRLIVGDNGKEIKSEFKIFQNLNTRATNKDLSFVISPEPIDGRKLTNENYKAIAEDFLKGLKLENHQAIVIKHGDRNHTHLHLFVNRIDEEGKAYNDSYISKESQTVADQVAINFGLTRARMVQQENEEKRKELKSEILAKHKAALAQRPRDLNTYIDMMKANGIKVIPTINKANRIQGFRVEYSGVNMKASEVHRSMSLSKMGVDIKQSEIMNPKLDVGYQKPTQNINKGKSKGIG